MPDAGFREVAADERIESVALSHLSLELGHLYMDDYLAGSERLLSQFRLVRPWAAAARSAAAAGCGDRPPRISTCFLIDDYFTRFSSPAKVLPDVVAAARECDLTIDYIALESGCAEADGVPLAEVVAGRLTALPSPGVNGSRPPALEIGWLCNGRRSPGVDVREAMNRPSWLPPVETDAPHHSVFEALQARLMERRDDLPPIVQVNPSAAPFCAYRSTSVIPARFLNVEHAVRVVLGQYSALPAVIDQIADRSGRERIELPADLTERINYAFFTVG